MPAKNNRTANSNLAGSAPDQCKAALLLIDVINDMEFPEGAALLRYALPAAKKIAALKRRAREAGVPVIYVNDNFGRWQSNFSKLVSHCLEDGVRGEPVTRLLLPEPDDYFVLKPKHSGFFSTALSILLEHIGAQTLILTGFAGNLCVLYTANDAYMNDFRIFAPRDCIASEEKRINDYALEQMERFLKADVRSGARVPLHALRAACPESAAHKPARRSRGR